MTRHPHPRLLVTPVLLSVSKDWSVVGTLYKRDPTTFVHLWRVHACVVAQSCPTLCHPVGCGPPGSSVHGILWASYWSGLPFPFPGLYSGAFVGAWAPLGTRVRAAATAAGDWALV